MSNNLEKLRDCEQNHMGEHWFYCGRGYWMCWKCMKLRFY